MSNPEDMDTRDVAERHGITDLFALRRISDEQLVNLAGAGRGEGWAGNISIDAQREPLVAHALTSTEVVRHAGESTRIFGPYWAEEAAIVRAGDFVVVLGGPGVGEIVDDDVVDAAADVAWSVGDVSAEKRLADELELTQAALSVASLPSSSVDEFLASLADTAMTALSCEFGAVVVLEPQPRLVVAPTGWMPDASQAEVLAALLDLVSGADLDHAPIVAQDLRHDATARSPLGFAEGLVSRCIIPLAAPTPVGALVVAHSTSHPRGFTSLCQQVAATIGEQASQVLETNLAQNLAAGAASPS